MAKNQKNFIIIDAQAVLHRAWHALPELTDPKGRVVNAVYGFTALLLKLIKEQNPSHLAVAFDTKAATFRHKEYKEYKAGREKQPQIFYDQIALTKEILQAFNIPLFSKDGFEADDIIGTIINKKEKKNSKLNFLIITGDLDLCQLIDDQTSVYFLRQGISQIKKYTKKEIKERFNLTPKQLIDFKALVGDPSDNIKGVYGVGAKTAAYLIEKFNSIENLYKNLKKESLVKKIKISEILLEKIKQEEERVIKNKKLIKIKKNVPGIKTEKINPWQNIDYKKITKIFEKFGFQSLIKRIEKKEMGQKKLF